MVFKFSVLWIGFLSNTKQPAQVAKDWSLFMAIDSYCI